MLDVSKGRDCDFIGACQHDSELGCFRGIGNLGGIPTSVCAQMSIHELLICHGRMIIEAATYLGFIGNSMTRSCKRKMKLPNYLIHLAHCYNTLSTSMQDHREAQRIFIHFDARL